MASPGPLHEIEVDRAQRLIDVRLYRIFTPEDAGWIGEEVRAAVRSFGPLIGTQVTLYDCSALQAAPTATVEAIRQAYLSDSVTPLRSRRIAAVVGTTVARMQAQRVAEVVPEMRVFDSREAALAWLLEPQPPAR